MTQFNRTIKKVLLASAILMIACFAVFAVFNNSHEAKADINPMLNFTGKVVNSDGSVVADNVYDFNFGLYTTATSGTAIWSEDLTAANLFSAAISGVSTGASSTTYTYTNGSNKSTFKIGQYLTNASTTEYALITDYDTTANTVTVADTTAWSAGEGINNRPRVEGAIIDIDLGAVSDLSSVNFDQTLYLEIVFNSETMQPRKLITSSAQTFNASKLDNISSEEFAVLSDNEAITGEWSFGNIVNIATSSADAALTVTQSGAGDLVNIFDGSTEIFTITDGGFVGIGTSTPYSKLSIWGSAGNLLELIDTASTTVFVVNTDGDLTTTGTTTMGALTYPNYDGITNQVLSADGAGNIVWSSTAAATPHNILSAQHTDTTAAAVVRGDLMTGQGGTPTWSRLALGASGYILYSNGTDTLWQDYGIPFYTYFNATTTDALTEGSSNLYWTDTRFDNRLSASSSIDSIITLNNLSITESQISDLDHFDGADFYAYFNATTTDALTEGSSNLYWTDTRFDERLTATTSLPALTTLANLDTVGTLSAGTLALDSLSLTGTLDHEYGGLEADVSSYAGLISITGGATAQVDSIAELNALLVSESLASTTHTWADAYVNNDITLNNITQITSRAISDTTGTLQIGRGGTGLTSFTAGDLIYASADDTLSALASSTSGYVLSIDFTTGLPSWVATTTWGRTQEEIEDYAGAMVSGNTETLITVTYQDGDGTIDYVVDNDLHNYSWANVTAADMDYGTHFYTYFNATTTDALTEGSSNLYWTDTRFDERLTATTTLPALTTLSNLTTVGTIGAGTWQGTAIGAAYGGTGLSTYVIGDILYADAANSLSRLATSTAGSVLQLDLTTGLPSYAATSSLGIALSDTEGLLQTSRGGTGQDFSGSTGFIYLSSGTASASSTIHIGNTDLIAGTGLTLTSATLTLDEFTMGTTDTDATAGSVFFAGTSGVLQQDNANFFWDDANNRLGIGTAAPQQSLHVEGQCVTGDTLLPIINNQETITKQTSIINNQYSNDNQDNIEYIQIKDVEAGMMVMSLNEKTGELTPARINGLLDMGVKTIYEIETEDGKKIRTTGNHPYLVASKSEYKTNLSMFFRVMEKNNAKEYQQNYTHNNIEDNIKHNLFFSAFANNDIADDKQNTDNNVSYKQIHIFDDGKNFNPKTRHAIASKAPIVNVSGLKSPIALFGKNTATNVAPNNNLDKSIKYSDIFSSCAFDSFINNDPQFNDNKNYNNLSNYETTDPPLPMLWRASNRKQATDSGWVKVAYLSEGDKIAVANDNLDGVEFVKIKRITILPPEQVYDIEVEGTHNFVANNIIAHNTYISGNTGIGTSTPYSKLSIWGSNNLLELSDTASTTVFLVDSSGNLTITGTTTMGALTYPNYDGITNQVLSADGAGNIVWSSTAAATPHNILSAQHTDTTAAAVVRGDLMTGQGGTPTWSRLALGASGYILYSNGTDTLWQDYGIPFYTYFNATTTDALTEGSSNLYWTDTRFDERLTATTTLPALTTLSNLTTVGTIGTGIWQGTAIGAAYGGTGLSTYVIGDILYADAANSLSRLATSTAGSVLQLSFSTGLPSYVATSSLGIALSDTEGLLQTSRGGTGQDFSGSTGFIYLSSGTASASSTIHIGNTDLIAGTGLTLTSATLTLDEFTMGTTDTDATAGSVFFAGTSGVLQQDNSNFFWDDAKNRLGIGTASPGYNLEIDGTARITGATTLSTTTMSVWNNVVIVDGVNYSADGTGIQAAIDALPAEGGKVFIPEGTYSMTATTTIPSNVWLEGAGASSTILYLADGANTVVLTNSDWTNGNSHIKISNLKIDGNDVNNTGAYCHGIHFDTVTYSEIDSVYAYDAEDSGVFLNDSASYNNIIKSVFESNNRGVRLDTNSQHNKISNSNFVSNTSEGVRIDYSGCHYNVITDNTMVSNGTGVLTSDYIDYTIISNNNIYNSINDGIFINHGTYNSIIGNVIRTYGVAGINAKRSDRNNITDNTIIDDDDKGIYLQCSSACNQSYNVISDNYIAVSDGHGIYLMTLSSNNTITSNVIEGDGNSDSSDDGIYIEGDSNNNIISSNRITGKDRYGINISASTVDGTYLVGNELTGNVNDINDEGTDTNYGTQLVSDDLILKSAGNVGINTTAPQQTLTLGSGSNFAQEMAAPSNAAAVAGTGTLAADEYFFRIVASDGVGTTLGSTEISTTTSFSGLDLSWTATTGAVSYRVYYATTTEDYYYYFANTDTSYTFATSTGGTAASLPSATTAYVTKLSASGDSWMLGGNLGIGTTSPDILLHVGSSTPSTVSGYRDAFFAGALEVNDLFYINGTGTSTIAGNFDIAGDLEVGNSFYVNSSGAVTTGTWNGAVIGATYGGTAQSSWTAGDILYSNASDSLAKLGIGNNGEVLTISGGVPSWTSTSTLLFDNDFSSNGIMVRTAAGTYTTRTLTGTANEITITNGDGVSGAPTFELPDVVYLGTAGKLGRDADNLLDFSTDNQLTFRTNATDQMVLNSLGYLGIGTTTPQAALHIGTASSTKLTTYGDSVFISGELEVAETTYLGPQEFAANSGAISWIDMPVTSSASAGTVESYTARLDGTNLLTVYSESDGAGGIQNTGVGIGTTTPFGFLSVNASSTDPALAITQIDSGNQGPIAVFYDGVSEKIRIDSSGYLGIASTSPSASLSTGGLMYIGGTGTSTIENNLEILGALKVGASSLYIDNTGVVQSGTWQGTAVATQYGGTGQDFSGSTGFMYLSSGTASASSTIHIGNTDLIAGTGLTLTSATLTLDEFTMGTTDTDATAGSVFFAGTSGVLQQDNSNFFWDDTNNRLGVGTAGPQQTLTLGSGSNFAQEMAAPSNAAAVAGTGTLAADEYFFRIVASDGVGTTIGSTEISTTTSFSGLDLSWTAPTGASSYRVYFATTTEDYYYYFDNTDTTYTFATSTGGTAASLPSVTTAYVSKLTASGDSWLLGGNLGIGTSTPQAKLTVQTDSGDLLNVWNSSSEVLTVLNNGNVGIGTSTPSEKLTLNTGNFLQTPSDPVTKGNWDPNDINIMDNAFSFYVSGKYAYVAGYLSHNMAIIDISNPASPTTIGNWDPNDANIMDYAVSVYVSGKYAYVAGAYSDNMAIVDISNPASPTTIGNWDPNDANIMDGAYSVYVSGKYAYVAGVSSDNMAIVDISNPASPTTIGNWDPNDANIMDGAYSVYVSGKYAYVTGGFSDNMAIVDISNPASPTTIGNWDPNDANIMDGARSVYASGKYAYVAGYVSDNMAIVDISNPASPTTIGNWDPNDANIMDYAQSVYVSGKYAYVAGGFSDNMAIVDISNPASPTTIGNWDPNDANIMNWASSVYVSGKYAYVTGGASDNMAIVDISGIDSPSANIGDLAVGTIDVWENMDIGNNLYVGNGLNIGPGGLLSQGQGAFSMATSSSLSDLFAIQGNLTDSNTNSIVDILNLSHMAYGSSANNIGTGLLFSSEDDYGSATSTARIASIFTNVSSTTPASALTFSTKNTSGSLTERMRIDSAGNLGIGTSTPYSKLAVVDTSATVSDDVFVISTSTSGTIFKVDGAGNFYYDGAGSSPSADYAEYFYTKDTDLESGEVVCVDVEQENAVKRCDRGADGNVMGIVSTKPAIIGNAKDEYIDNINYKIIGMLGQVQAKVSAENGEIRPGDSLTSASSTPGYVMKAGAGDPTVGIALEELEDTVEDTEFPAGNSVSGARTGVINVLISRRNKSLTVELVEQKITDRIADMEIEDEVNILIANAVGNLDIDDEINANLNPKLLLLESRLTVQTDDLTGRITNIESDIKDLADSIIKLDNDISNFEFRILNFETRLADCASSSDAVILNDRISKIEDNFIIDENGNIKIGNLGETEFPAGNSVSVVEIITATTTEKTAFVVNQAGDGDVADFQTDGVSIVNIADTGKVTIIGEMLVDGRIMVCSGSGCGSALDERVDETMGDMGVEGTVVAGAFEGYCEDGFVWVPGSAKYGTLPGFCVMDRESIANNIANNRENDELWTNVSQGEAMVACQSLGDNYHLISENEWMTIAENIIRVVDNDINEELEGLQLATSTNYDANPPINANPLIANDANYDANPPINANPLIANDANYDANPPINANPLIANDASSSIAYILTNGNVIYDMAGGIAEWTDQTVTKAGLPEPVSDEWQEYYEIENYNGFNIAPPYYYTSENGIGLVKTGDNELGLRGFVRGYNGIYSLDLSHSPVDAMSDVGFRCAR